MNALEKALNGSNDDVDFYLENTSIEQFRTDIKDMMDRHTDTEVIKEKIIALIKAFHADTEVIKEKIIALIKTF